MSSASSARAAAPRQTSVSNGPTFGGRDVDHEIRLDVKDLPRVNESMDVEGFKPSLLSRVIGMMLPK